MSSHSRLCQPARHVPPASALPLPRDPTNFYLCVPIKVQAQTLRILLAGSKLHVTDKRRSCRLSSS
eukprot:4807024-Prymnesium_polylepis.1